MSGQDGVGQVIESGALTRGVLLRRGTAAGAGLAALAALGGDGLGATLRATERRAKPKPAKLTVWLAGFGSGAKKGTPLRKWYDDEVKRFIAANPGSSVQTVVQSANNDQFLAVLRAAFAAHKVPDAMMLYSGGYTVDYAKSLVNLRPYVSSSLYNEYNAWSLSCNGFNCTNNAPIYGIPNDVGGFVIFYNKAHFASAGIPQKPFASWSDMLAAAGKLKAAGITPFTMGNRDGYSAANWVAVMLGSYIKSAADIAAFRSGKIHWDDPRMVKPVDQYNQLFTAGYTNPDARSREQLDANNDFTSGKAAMVLMYPSLVVDFRKGLGSKLGIMKLPPAASGPLSQAMNVISGQNWAIPKDSKNQALAWQFVKTIADPKSQTESLRLSATPPANKLAKLSIVKDPVLKTFLKYLQEQPSFPLIDSVVKASIATVWYKELALSFAGQSSAQSAMSAVQAASKNQGP
jgi:raffinose/stachyose/melibiose transport system substrate-binding protein